MSLSVGTSGNVSALVEESFLITPSGTHNEELKADDVIGMDPEGLVISGNHEPSSEWRFHRDIYINRIDVNAIIHIHSPYVTAISCARRPIPAFHYVVALVGDNSIPCADYATFSTAELFKNILNVLGNSKACLLANHGMIALGIDLIPAFRMAQEVEMLAKQYWLNMQLDGPILLDDDEIRVNLEKIKTNGN